MFLDDELLEMCRGREDPSNTKNLQQLNEELVDRCQEYYMARIKPGMPKKDAKAVIDRTFNLFDSFVRKALKNDDPGIRLMGIVLEEYPFKKQFMQHEELAAVYKNLSE